MTTKSDFAVAEEIKVLLDGRDKGEQERILRWVCESAGLSLVPPVQAAPFVAPSAAALPAGAAAPSGAAIAPQAGHAPRAADLRSFVEEKQPKTDVQFAATVAYYYRFMAPDADRKETITSEDLQTGARLANHKRFDTPSVPLNNAIRDGYIDRAGQGVYKLNAVGENLVAMTLPGAANGAAAGGAKKRNGKKAAKKKG